MVCGGFGASRSALATGTSLVIAATDQMRPMPTTTAIAMKEGMCIPRAFAGSGGWRSCRTLSRCLPVRQVTTGRKYLPRPRYRKMRLADHDAVPQHAEIVLVWTNRRALEDDQRRQPGPRELMAKTWTIQTIQKPWEATSARNRRRVAS